MRLAFVLATVVALTASISANEHCPVFCTHTSQCAPCYYFYSDTPWKCVSMSGLRPGSIYTTYRRGRSCFFAWRSWIICRSYRAGFLWACFAN
ncbi:uncharacterized protein F5147DRAFT_701169 [Suillus discolor]|uniref:Secreted protein n=1 Tax=Suillus discolor TaxID=1912936 RepID=A0A9P7JSF6_9AGAM|nr:uncharacterized protein F5147DRAFT_701169 [Suillus discolor]KAG2106148.1 hypothetical protein F5147DRAFT_701169 [Suillus discolor]